ALTEADHVLRQTDDVGAYPVRQQVAREVMTLRSLEDVDRTGLYLQLDAAIDSVSRLTDSALSGNATISPGQNTDAAPDAPPGNSQSWWRTVWQQMTDTLGRVVVVRRMDEPV